MSIKLLMIAFVILAGVVLSGCLCCCTSPDYGTYSPPKVLPVKVTVTPTGTAVPTVVPIMASNVTVTPVPTGVVTLKPTVEPTVAVTVRPTVVQP